MSIPLRLDLSSISEIIPSDGCANRQHETRSRRSRGSGFQLPAWMRSGQSTAGQTVTVTTGPRPRPLDSDRDQWPLDPQAGERPSRRPDVTAESYGRMRTRLGQTSIRPSCGPTANNEQIDRHGDRPDSDTEVKIQRLYRGIACLITLY